MDPIDLLRSFGFPAAVAVFVLVRLDQTLRQIRDDQRELLDLFDRLRRPEPSRRR